MRFPRVKAEGQSFYHCVSRVVDRQFIFQTAGHGSPEAERFVRLMRQLEAFSGVRVLTYPLISNHFHLLCEVPQAHRTLCPTVQPSPASELEALHPRCPISSSYTSPLIRLVPPAFPTISPACLFSLMDCKSMLVMVFWYV